jgi:endonuclease YncB( thermonuclease family)
MRNILLIALLTFPIFAFADTIDGRVIAITDGDTVKVLDASQTLWKVRLMGIDAPEKKMPFGDKSKQYLSSLVFNQQVKVEYSKKDKYGRVVGKILVDGVDANLEQVKAGLAWHYKQYQKEQTTEDRAAYVLAEEMARNESIGVWSVSDPMPPWEWRHQRKK